MSAAHIHILFGSDEFAIAKKAESFVKSMGDPTTASMNTSRLDMRSATENQLNNAVNAMPFLAAQRLVLLDSPSKKYTGQDGHKKFLTFLDAAPPSALMLILEPGEIKEREKASHWLLKWSAKNAGRAAVHEFNLPRQREMPRWIVEETARQGGKIEQPAAARLAEMTGENTRQAAMEIAKLLTYVNFSHPIGLEDVEAVSIVTAQASVFDMVDAMGLGDTRRAQKSLRQLLDEDEPFSIFGMVVRQFRMLLIAREVLDEGGSLNEVTKALGAHPFVAEKVANQARGFTLPALENIHRRLLSMDEDAKTGGMPLDTALEMFVIELGKKP